MKLWYKVNSCNLNVYVLPSSPLISMQHIDSLGGGGSLEQLDVVVDDLLYHQESD